MVVSFSSPRAVSGAPQGLSLSALMTFNHPRVLRSMVAGRCVRAVSYGSLAAPHRATPTQLLHISFPPWQAVTWFGCAVTWWDAATRRSCVSVWLQDPPAGCEGDVGESRTGGLEPRAGRRWCDVAGFAVSGCRGPDPLSPSAARSGPGFGEQAGRQLSGSPPAACGTPRRPRVASPHRFGHPHPDASARLVGMRIGWHVRCRLRHLPSDLPRR